MTNIVMIVCDSIDRCVSLVFLHASKNLVEDSESLISMRDN